MNNPKQIFLVAAARLRGGLRFFCHFLEVCAVGAGIMILDGGCRSTVTTTNGQIGSKPLTGNFYFLPRGRVRITGAFTSKDQTAFVITIAQLFEADPAQRYFLQHSTNAFFDDEIKITVNEKGLLTTVNSTSEDKTAAIAGSLTGIVADVMRFGAGANATGLAETPVDPRKPFSYVFDPFDSNDVDKTNKSLSQQGFHLAVDRLDAYHAARDTVTPDALAGESLNVEGVVFRPLQPIKITVDDNPSMKSQSESQVVMLPDVKTKLLLDFRRAAFVKKVTNVGFVDGALREINVTKPSQVLGLLAIPKEIVKAIVPLPLELKQIQVNNMNAEKSLIDAEKALAAAKVSHP